MTRRIRIEDIYAIAQPEQPALSPEGQHIAYVLRTSDRAEDRDVQALYAVDTHSGPARQLTSGPADSAPAWSPDGQQLAFLRGHDTVPQIWLLPAGGGEATSATTLPLGAGAPVWSPDGTKIAFAAPVDTADAAVSEAAPVVIDRLGFKADGAGLLRGVRRHLHVLDLATGAVAQLTSGSASVSDPRWSADGTQLAYVASVGEDTDRTLRSSAHIIAVGNGSGESRRVGACEGVVSVAEWIDGDQALLVVGSEAPGAGFREHRHLLRIPLDGGPVANLSAALDRNVMVGAPGYPGASPQVCDDGRTVLFCVRDRGCTHLYSVDLTSGDAPRQILGGADRSLSGLSYARGLATVVLATPTSYGEIVVLDLDLDSGHETVRTEHRSALSDVDLLVPEQRDFTVSDGTVVHAWILADPRRTGPAPLLLDIHGGPHNAWTGMADPVMLYLQILAARGWVVVLPNPRGSDGYGEEFFTSINGSWGELHLADLLEPLDQLVAEGVADPDRLAVAGYSYGGYMTNYLISHDDRFKAAVAGGAICDLTSFAGSSDVTQLMDTIEIKGLPWRERDRFAAQSPLTNVERVSTPTLVWHGLADERVPALQAEQWFTALRQRDVETQLVFYPGSSHLFRRPSHREDVNRRVIAWITEHVPDGSPAPMDVSRWKRRLTELATKHRVPGASLGVLRLGPDGSDELVRVSQGVLSKNTGVEVTEDTIFQIGSITKVWTATLVMQLVDDGMLDLDQPIVEVLPELVLGDPEATASVTMRHLLTHTSGIDGDVFADTGPGDDCLERYVDQLAEVGQNHPVGATFSYCNSGFVLAGRVIEKLTGKTWDRVLAERLIEPLRLAHTTTSPEKALLFRTAVGHLGTGETEPVPTQTWVLPRTTGPAGRIFASTADVLAFARMHLENGSAADGSQVLSAAGVQAMAARHVDLPDKHTLGESWGLGWIRWNWSGHDVIGHDGSTIGQSAYLRIVPDAGLAIILLTNGGNTRDLYEELFSDLLDELADITMPSPLAPFGTPPVADLDRYVGQYERASVSIDIRRGNDGLTLRQSISGLLADLLPADERELDLVPVSDGVFAFRRPGVLTWTPVTFYTLPTRQTYVHTGARATSKAR